MAAISSADIDPNYDNLVLELKNEAPISVADLARLFDDLARDYRTINRGHELLIVRLSQGSLLTILRDAVEFVSAANSIVKFGRTLSEAYKFIRDGGSKKKSVGVRTVESLVRLASNSASAVEVRYRGPLGDELFVRASPVEVGAAQREITRRKLLTTSKKRKDSGLLKIAGTTVPTEFDRLLNASGKHSRELEKLVSVVVKFLREHGMSSLLPVLARELESRGNNDAARLIRAITDEKPGDSPRLR